MFDFFFDNAHKEVHVYTKTNHNNDIYWKFCIFFWGGGGKNMQ